MAPRPANVPFGGVAICDPKVHGTPVRFASKEYRVGSKSHTIGSPTFLNIFGSSTESTLQVVPPSSHNAILRVLLQCVMHVVDRKSGKTLHLLVTDIDVTSSFRKAARAEFAQATGTTIEAIDIADDAPEPPPPFPTIDWIAVADDLQSTSDTADLVDASLPLIARLAPDSASMRSLQLRSEISYLQASHAEFLILRPSSYHGNGMPSNMCLPWVSAPLWESWYGSDGGVGRGREASSFQQSLVAAVAKKWMREEAFDCRATWGEREVYCRCVPLMEEGEGEMKTGLWVAFVKGDFDI